MPSKSSAAPATTDTPEDCAPVARWDRSLLIYQAFYHIGCFMIVLRWAVRKLLHREKVKRSSDHQEIASIGR
jgi:hypothetical protein